MIESAKLAGADAVKFQAFFDEPLFCPYEGDEKRWPRWGQTFLTEQEWMILHEEAGQSGIDLLLSVFSHRGITLLKKMKPRYVKVASRAAKTFPYDELPGLFLISTGMGAPESGPWNPYWLQCDARYPSPMIAFDSAYDGISDHSGTTWPGMDAIFRGAGFLEVHFTIPGTDPGPDRPVCLSLEQLKFLCEARDAVAAMHSDQAVMQKAHTGAS